MQTSVQWLEIWRELAELHEQSWHTENAGITGDHWSKRAEIFNADVKRRWAAPDSSRDFVAAQLKAHPDWTVLDVGGGVGAWAVFMAQKTSRVTVIEPSSAMIQVMKRNLAEARIQNVDIVQEKWPEARVAHHDLTFCAHAMYGFADFSGFIRSLEGMTRHLCVLIMRAPTPKDLLSVAAMHIRGQPYDSPNFQIAYNALLQMGIFPNVIIENTGLWDPWTSASLDEALATAKSRLGLPRHSEHDRYLGDLVAGNLVYQDGRFVWPRSMRTALVYWTVDSE